MVQLVDINQRLFHRKGFVTNSELDGFIYNNV